MSEERNLSAMTEGKIFAKLTGFALPMFLCTAFQQLYSTVDAIIVGRFAGEQGLAAIGVTSQIIMLSVSIGIGLMMGVSVSVSENFGAEKWDKVRQTEVVAVYVVLGTYLMKLIVGAFLAEPILTATKTPPEVLAEAVLYLRIVFCGGLFTYAYSMCIYILRACGDGMRPLMFLAFSSVCNVFLDLLFVKGLAMGVAGAAVGTVISESLAVVLCLIYMKKKTPLLWLRKSDFKETSKELTMYVLKLSLPTSLQIGAVSFCTILVQAVINQYGTVVVAGYTAAQKIEQVVTMAINAYSGALNTFTAQNRGAGKMDRVREGKRITIRISAVMSLLVTALIFLFGENVLGLFVEGGQDVVREGMIYLRVTCGFYICMALWQTYMAVLRGMADVRIPLLIGAIQILANLAGIWVLEPHLGKTGIWWSVAMSWSLCLLTAWIRFRRVNQRLG